MDELAFEINSQKNLQFEIIFLEVWISTNPIAGFLIGFSYENFSIVILLILAI